MSDIDAAPAPRVPSVAEQLDAIITRLVAGAQVPVRVEGELRPLVAAARALAAALRPVPVAPRFEARLGTRLAQAGGPLARRVRAFTGLTRRELRHPGRLIAAGAVSSAAVGVGVTALAVWRGGRRHTGRSTRRWR
jgi:hypothetical protein